MADAMLADMTRPVTGGVDTHKDVHVAAVVDHLGTVLGTRSFPTTTSGYRDLVEWVCSHGDVGLVGVEGTGAWGAGLSRHLAACDIGVVEINRPDRQTRRRTGKSDPLDAIAAAQAALVGRHVGQPKAGDGPVEAIRMLRVARRSAVRDRTATINQIRSVIDTAPQQTREQLRELRLRDLIATITAAQPPGERPVTTDTATYTLGVLGRRWEFLNDQIAELDTRLDDLVATTAPTLIGLYGVGTDTAAALLICAGDNPDRIGNERAFAALCGTSPLLASSGRTHRHRLNRGGNRDANSALWRITLVRMAHDPRTRTYVERRTTEGLSKREIIRCLKRYIAREIYPAIICDLTPNT